MLEQEKELTAVSRILEETWERLVTLVDAYKEQLRVQKEVGACPDLLGNLPRPVGKLTKVGGLFNQELN